MKDRPKEPNLDEWIAAALLDDLSPEDRAAFDRYLNENPDAREQYQDTMAASEFLEKSLATATPAPNFEDRLIHAVRQRSKRTFTASLWELVKSSWRRPYFYIPAGAAVLLGMIKLGAVLTRPDEATQIASAVAAYSTEDGTQNAPLPAEASNASSVSRKLDEIVIPRIDLKDTTVREALSFLKQRAVALDTAESDSRRKGVNIVMKADTPEAEARITLSLTDVPLRTALEYVGKAANLRSKIEPYAVVMSPLAEASETLVSKEYHLPPGFLAGLPSASSSASLPGASAGSQAASGSVPAIASRSSAKDFLMSQGVDFPPGASANFLASSNRLIVKNTQANLDLIDSLTSASSSRVSSSTQDLLQQGNAFLESGRYDLANKRYEQVLALDQQNVAARQGVEAASQAKANYYGQSYNDTRSRQLWMVDNKWDRPVRHFTAGATTITDGVAQNNVTVAPVFTSSQGSPELQSFVNYGSPITTVAASTNGNQPAISTGDAAGNLGTDLKSSPTVTTRSGRTAQVRVAEYPTEFSPTTPQTVSAPVTAGNRTASTAITANAIDGLLFASAKDKTSAAPDEKKEQPSNLGLTSQRSAQAPITPPLLDNRKLVRNASLDLEVKNYEAALDSITAIAAGNSGYVATKNSARLANGKMSGTVVVKVLPDRLEPALLQIRELGELKNQSLSTQDVTKEYFDTDARLRNARKMEERLLALLDTMKGKVSELLQVEKELARVREQIEQMQGELKVYDSLVQFATITISLREKDLNEAAAYLLKANVSLSLFSSDVEKTYEAARVEAEADKAQIVQSRLVRDTSGRATATLNLLIAPDSADSLIARLKGLGRVQTFNKDDQRVARDGSGDSATAKVERDKVQLALTIVPDDESRKQVGLTVVAQKVGAALAEAKAATAAQGAEIVNSGLQHSAGGDVANLTVRVPGANYEALLEAFKQLGLVSQFGVQRDDVSGQEAGKAPVLIALALTDATQPVQFTQAALLTSAVEQQASRLKQIISAHQGEVVSSTFERQPDGTQVANLALRLPLAKYQAFFDEAAKLGQVKDLTVQREDRGNDDPKLATAQVSLRLFSQAPVVADDNGLFATLRKTLSQGASALLWSVRMIGVALAFLAPWVLALAATAWIIVRLVRTRQARTPRQ